jgi:hypothetical protein
LDRNRQALDSDREGRDSSIVAKKEERTSKDIELEGLD